MENPLQLPNLPYKENVQKKMTLHLFLQIIGKIRLKMTPRKNHWWYITQYIGTRGFTSGPIPYNSGSDQFEITINVVDQQLEVTTSRGDFDHFPLHNTLTVADFYKQLMGILEKRHISVSIVNVPFDLGIEKPFDEITEYHHYDPDYTKDLWRIMLWINNVFTEFSGRFYGKTCPVQLYWHSFDLVVTRFSGNEAPPMPADARLSDKDAYTHECISFGFWPGDENVPEPAFYSYTYPSPKGIDKEPIKPATAAWIESNGSPMALLKYKDLLNTENPRQELLNFLESTYQAGAKKANWDIKKFRVPDLEDL
ncbi:DUF5996 family protein [Gelidibacter gilvus]|uniref:Ava_C0101 and related proteins n=1 Tax=Gelidibacter gilvus TaxID=59602 RepID=A0A4Q0XE35_9FLAO|nr:DUF5996 family protein [Gelidibacter gilvus]RXJ46007.1 hypothetical protein ESZ48_13010 [Gelidibacter gilvus]